MLSSKEEICKIDNMLKIVIVGLYFLSISSGFEVTEEISEYVEDDEDSRIIGGQEVSDRAKYPFIISLHIDVIADPADPEPPRTQICGGSIINTHWILTAAHCLMDEELYVVAGKINLTEVDDKYVQTVRVAERYAHPNYAEHGALNDIALLFLERKLNFNQYVQPIIIPEPDDPLPESGKAMMIGWGLTRNGFLMEESNQLREAHGKIRPRNGCLKLQDYNISTQICIGKYARTACLGDSGGPLIIDTDIGPKQVGIASYVSMMPTATCTGDAIYTWIGAYLNSFVTPILVEHEELVKRESVYTTGVQSAPFLVYIMHFADVYTYHAEAVCTGIIIDPNWVLTSANCLSSVKRLPGDGFYILAGASNPYNLLNNNFTYWMYSNQLINVDSILIHSEYKEGTFTHDTAILRLHDALEVNMGYIGKLNIPKDVDYQPTGTLRAAGHVRRGTASGHILSHNSITSFPVTLDGINECQKYHPERTETSTFCVKPSAPDICSLDVGGPVYDETLTIIGFSSWRNRPCGIIPEVYNKITDDLPFIQNALGA